MKNNITFIILIALTVGLIAAGALISQAIGSLQTEQRLNIIGNTKTPELEPPTADEIIKQRRDAIESLYPELKDFDTVQTFAEQSISSLQVGNYYYFAYIVHGSGLPIVSARCFGVSPSNTVTALKPFPDPLDSYLGYPQINPSTCKGTGVIK